MDLFGDQVPQGPLASAAEVPQLPRQIPRNYTPYQTSKSGSMPAKKPRLMTPHDDGEYFTVPDLG